MRQAGRLSKGGCRLWVAPSHPCVGWGGESPKGVCLSQYRGVSVPFPRTLGLARCRGSLDFTVCPVIPDNRSRCGEQGSPMAAARMAWERGMVWLSGRDGGEGPSVAILAFSATFKLTVEQGIIFQTIFKLCKELK